MRIGFDFDNTLVDYSQVFSKIADDLDINYDNNPKNSIKNYFEKELNIPNKWKEVQTRVYCEYIYNIRPSYDLLELINWLIENNHDFFIISHKTKTIKYDTYISNLRGPANNWIESNIPSFNKERIFYENSAISKIRKIESLNLDFFVDDLLTILNHRQFPKNTQKILFNSSSKGQKYNFSASDWQGVKKILLDNE